MFQIHTKQCDISISSVPTSEVPEEPDEVVGDESDSKEGEEIPWCESFVEVVSDESVPVIAG